MHLVLIRERQATYQHRQVSYHRQATDKELVAVEEVYLQLLTVAHRNWHKRS
jgi:hypothetical protein